MNCISEQMNRNILCIARQQGVKHTNKLMDLPKLAFFRNVEMVV